MADNNDSTMNKKPNSLDRIGTEEGNRPSKSKMDEYALFEQRSRFKTQEIRHLEQQLRDKQAQYDRVMAAVGRVTSQQQDPTEGLYRALGMTANQARATLSSKTVEQQYGVIDDLVIKYATKWADQQQVVRRQLQEKQADQAAIAARMFQQNVISRVSHPRSGIKAEILANPEAMQLAQEYASSLSPEAIQKSLARLQRSRKKYGLETAEAAGHIQEPGGAEKYKQINTRYEEQLYKEHVLEESRRISDKKIKDHKKLAAITQRTMEDIAERRGESFIKSGVSSGQFGSLKDIENSLKSAEEQFKQAGKTFISVMGQTGDVSDKAAEALKQAKDELDDWRMISREAGGGRRGGGRFGGANRIASFGDLAGRGVDLAGYLAVGLQSEQMGMRIGMAGAMNQRNADIFAATQGNMAALRRLTENQFETAVNFSGAYRTRANTAGGLGSLIDIGTGAAGAVATAGGAFPWSLTGGNIASNLLSGARSGARVLSGVTGAETQLQFFQQFNQLKDVINDIPDASKQAFFDYRQNALMSMRGAGQRTSAMYDEAVSTATMMQMAAMGVAPTETNRLFGVGINAIGASFVRDPSAARQMVARGAELQAGGYMSAEDYLQRVGQAAALGGGQKDIEEILARAVTRGVDDARSLNNLFNVIGSLARGGTSPGTPSVGAAASAMSSMMDMLKDLPIDETLKQTLAASEIEKANQRTSFSNVDIPSMVYLQGIQERFPGISTTGQAKLANVPLLEQISKLKLVSDLKPGEDVPLGRIAALGGTRGAFLEGFKFRGVGDSFFDDLVLKALASNVPEISDISGRDAATLKKYLRTGDENLLYKELSKEGKERIDVGRVIADRALISAGYRKDLPSVPLPGLTGEAAATQATFGIQAGGLAKQVLAGQSFYEQLGEQARLAGGGGPLQPPYAGAMQSPMSYVSTMMGMQLEEYSPEKAGKEAAQAAEKMTLDSSEFDKSVTNFSAAVDKLVKAVQPLGTNLSYSIDYGYSNMGPLANPETYGAYVQQHNQIRRNLNGR
jgi:hypothetical protein